MELDLAFQTPPRKVANHPHPAVVCLPGSKNVYSDAIRSTFTGQGAAVGWPQGTRLRAKILPGEKTSETIVNVVKQSAAAWFVGIGTDGLSMEWVSSNETADIRVSFRVDEPNWSAWGPRAKQYDQSQPTMNFQLGGWKSHKNIWSHAAIWRLAAHLFGHAFGLPDGPRENTIGWHRPETEKQCGSFFTAVFHSSDGDSRLNNVISIMRYDHPTALMPPGSTSKLEWCGGYEIDEDSRALFKRLYTRRQAYNVNEDHHNYNAKGSATSHVTETGSHFGTSNIISSLLSMDIATKANPRIHFRVLKVNASNYDYEVGTTAPSFVDEARFGMLSFYREDNRIQTGVEDYATLRGGQAPRPGWARNKLVTFPRSFDQVPCVVVFIAGFEMQKEGTDHVRLHVYARDISRTGFNMVIDSWHTSTMINVQASWLAHEPNDWSLRSGVFYPPPTPATLVKTVTSTSIFSTPMQSRPAKIFGGFNYIDAPVSVNIRLTLYWHPWTESSLTTTIYTTEEESKFFQVGASYVAFHEDKLVVASEALKSLGR